MPKILAKSTMGSPLARLVESRIFKEYSLYLSTGRRQGIEYRYSKTAIIDIILHAKGDQKD